jgi:hypothetical protein
MRLGLQSHPADYPSLVSKGPFYRVCSDWQWHAPQLDQCHLLLQIVEGNLDQIQPSFPVINNERYSHLYNHNQTFRVCLVQLLQPDSL